MWKFPGHTDIASSLDWDGMTRNFEWIRDMIGVRQDPRHHGEGDVHTHTRMVVQALLNLPEYQALGAQDRAILFAAACLHDVEKRSTTLIETDETGVEHISAHGHARKGEYTARSVLYKDVRTPFAIREQICGLVRYHGLPIWMLEKESPERMVAVCSHACDTGLLYILSKADMTGRICSDPEKMLEQVEMFKEYCIEQECFGRPKEFKSNLGRYKYLNEGGYAELEPFDDKKSRAIIMSGLPGSGKDHAIKRFIAQGAVKPENVISLDDMRRERGVKRRDTVGNGHVIQDAKKRMKELLARGETFVWNATNITKELRSAIVGICMDYNAYVEICYVEAEDFKSLLEQNKDRPDESHEVKRKAIEGMLDKLEMPTVRECHEVTVILK